MRETTKYKRLQGTSNLFKPPLPLSAKKKMPLAETHVIKRRGGPQEHQRLSVVAHVHAQDNPPESWDKSKTGDTRAVDLFELGHILSTGNLRWRNPSGL